MNVDWSRVYIDFARVGADEFLVQNEKLVKSKQLKQITKAILRMNIAMVITRQQDLLELWVNNVTL